MGITYAIHWRETEPVEATKALDHPLHCDVCVIGGGYTGLWAAHFLAQADPALDICVLEAEYAGAGASGHNDGFVTPTVGKDLAQLVRQFGLSQTRTATSAVGKSIMEIGRFCTRNQVDAEYEPNGYLMVAVDDAQQRRLERDRDLAERMATRVTPKILGATEAQARIGSPLVRAAMPIGGALINPHKLARGLARTVRGQGAALYENTPALHLTPVGGKYLVSTPHGSVTATKVVVATDAYQSAFPQFQHGAVAVWSYAMTTEPLTDEQLARIPWPDREGLVEARTLLRCARLTADNRILWGGGRTKHFLGSNMNQRHLGDRAAYRTLRASFEAFFPMLRDVPTSHAYGGRMAMTRDLVPHFGSTGHDLVHGYGYCGNGIAASHTGGQIIRDLVLERETEFTALPFVNRTEAHHPPQPWTYLRTHLRNRVTDRRDRRMTRESPAWRS